MVLGNGPYVLGILLQIGIMLHLALCRIRNYMLGNGPQVLGNGNGLHMLGNGLHFLGIISHSGLCRIRYYVAFRVISFGIMWFGIMSHSALCRIQGYIVWDCVVQRNVIGHNVVGRNVVRPTVYVSINPIFICSSSHWLLFLQLLLTLFQTHYLYFFVIFVVNCWLLFLQLLLPLFKTHYSYLFDVVTVSSCFFSCY